MGDRGQQVALHFAQFLVLDHFPLEILALGNVHKVSEESFFAPVLHNRNGLHDPFDLPGFADNSELTWVGA